MSKRWLTQNGGLVLTERSKVLPLVGFGVTVRSGSLFDPPGKEGLSRLMTRAMRMGTQELRSRALEERLDELGAQLSMSCSQSYMHFGGVVVAHNLAPFVELIAALLSRPAFRPADVRQVKRELQADLVSLCDDDRSLCGRHFRRYAFGSHPYGRPRSGTRESVARIEHRDVVAHHARHVVGRNLVIGAWGDFVPREFERLIERSFRGLKRGTPAEFAVPEPVLQPGRRLLIVDKPERTQTQLLIGTLGTSAHDRDHVALIAANAGFGGLFTSRLNVAVRVKRGLSYGASSSFVMSRSRDMWAMHTFPSAADARACLDLQLGLYDRWVQRGLGAREFAAARRYLVKSHAFEIDTAAKRLDQRLDIEIFDWPKTHHTGFIPRLMRLSQADVHAALQRRMSRRDQVIVLVATADEVAPKLRDLPGVSQLDVVPFDDI